MSEYRFQIRADVPSGRMMIVSEPEGGVIYVHDGETIVIIEDTDNTGDSPLTLVPSVDDDGTPVISVWPGNGDIRFEKDGVPVEGE